MVDFHVVTSSSKKVWFKMCAENSRIDPNGIKTNWDDEFALKQFMTKSNFDVRCN